jgi:transposase
LAHPYHVKAIAHAKVKTDKVDARILAHLLRADLIPAAYAAPPEVRQWRELVRARYAWTRQRTRAKNRIHALLLRRGETCPVEDLFGRGGRAWLAQLSLDAHARRLVEDDLRLIDLLNELFKRTVAQVQVQVKASPEARLLQTLPGFGAYTALMLLAEVGDLRRFPSADHLVAYVGLAPRVRVSAERTHIGGITKAGPPHLRWALTEAAHSAVRTSADFRALFEHVQARRGTPRAMITVCRRLLVCAYAMLKHNRSYREGWGKTSTSPLTGLRTRSR